MGEQTVTARLRAIEQLALKVFEDEGAAKDWLSLPNPALDGACPIHIAETAEGEERVKVVLGRIESGVYT
jgi:putative toxin-antitoxin system antitoxin component (TIGR02293 family)